MFVREKASLPGSTRLPIEHLSSIFSNTTNSYKLLFFHALINHLSTVEFAPNAKIHLHDLTVEMVRLAWFPHFVFRLSFGAQDQIADSLKTLSTNYDKAALANAHKDKFLQRQLLSANSDPSITVLQRYVPTRLLRPFFSTHLRGVPDHDIDATIRRLSSILFEESKPLYRFNLETSVIEVHPDWLAYFKENEQIVRGWAACAWLKYMQRRNPSTPAIASKLFEPDKRESLSFQTKYWKTIKQHKGSLRCIFTGVEISDINMSLDHFIPWSFVAHDQLWNIVPVLRSVNSAKSDRLPDLRYLDSLVAMQFDALQIAIQNPTEYDIKKVKEHYLDGVGFSSSHEMTDKTVFEQRMKNRLSPLLAMAASHGFECGWTPLM
jgi:5-methylcytosine-specific restriction endonuclease McrA